MYRFAMQNDVVHSWTGKNHGGYSKVRNGRKFSGSGTPFLPSLTPLPNLGIQDKKLFYKQYELVLTLYYFMYDSLKYPTFWKLSHAYGKNSIKMTL